MAYSHEHLDREIDILLTREPFYAHVLQGVGRTLTRKIPTASVAWTGQFYLLHINPDFFDKLDGPQRIAVLKHEVLHLVLRHLTRRGNKDPFVYNIAADLVVNQLCENLPPGALSLEDFSHYQLSPNKTLEEYYFRLLNRTKAGHNTDPEAADFAELWQNARTERGCHDTWQEHTDTPDAREDAEWKAGSLVLKAKAAMQLARRDQWSSLPLCVAQELESLELERAPGTCWKTALRRFATSASSSFIRTTVRRPSRRFGTLPGTRIQRKKRLLVAVDTSGSTLQAREAFFQEVQHIYRFCSDLWVVECDCKVGASYRFNGTTPSKVTGGGGTSFDPVFAWLRSDEARTQPHGGKFDGCIYFTDGIGPFLKEKPDLKILWVFPPGASASAPGPGEEVRMPL